MESITIPGTDLTPSRVGLGTWAIGGWKWGGADDANAVRTIHAALDRGITLIDTAPAYGFGHSEEVVGRALAEYGQRDKVVLATKTALEWQEGSDGVVRNASAARIEKEVEDSLRRLRTEAIDLYQIHWPDPQVPMEETANAMQRLYRAGKIRAIGVSNFSPEQCDAFREVAPLHSVQPPLNLFERDAERDMIPYAQREELVFLAYGALCRGLLTGKMHADSAFTGDDLRKSDPKFQPPPFHAVPGGGRGADAARARASRQAGIGPGGALGARFPSQCHRLVGRAASGSGDALGRAWRLVADRQRSTRYRCHHR